MVLPRASSVSFSEADSLLLPRFWQCATLHTKTSKDSRVKWGQCADIDSRKVRTGKKRLWHGVNVPLSTADLIARVAFRLLVHTPTVSSDRVVAQFPVAPARD